MESTRHDNRIVFRAAARAIGSNNRRWVDFQKVERKLAEETGGFDPTYTAKRGDEGTAAMKALLKGLTSTRDSDAIMHWARRLDVPDSFNACLLDWRRLIASSAAQRGVTLSHPELTAVIALALGAPGAHLQSGPFPLKAPGMGPTLASEFLRNLGWSGFKPDRHVMRLFGCWFPEDGSIRARARTLLSLLGLREEKAHLDFLYYSLLGAERSPGGMPVRQVDNLVWLYGAMVMPAPRKAPAQPRRTT